MIREDKPFKYSRLNEIAARQIDADYLLLPNDKEVIAVEWLRAIATARPLDGPTSVFS